VVVGGNVLGVVVVGGSVVLVVVAGGRAAPAPLLHAASATPATATNHHCLGRFTLLHTSTPICAARSYLPTGVGFGHARSHAPAHRIGHYTNA
jgi:hypothetical protein